MRAGVLPLESVVLFENVRARSRVSQAIGGELVPKLRHRAGQRAGRGRPLLAMRFDGGAEGTGTVVFSHYGLCRGAVAGLRTPGAVAESRADHATPLGGQKRRRRGGV